MNEKLIKDYKSFLDECKTERECVTRIIKDAEKKGYKDITKCKKLKSGDKVYITGLNEDGTKFERLYKVYGSENLDGGGVWRYPTNSFHRFFRVTVEMP